MDVRTWTTISRLLDEALDLPPEARPAWLESLAPEYDTLKPRLQAMLEEASRMGVEAFLATLPKLGDVAPSTDEAGLTMRVGREGAMVGPYRLVREIASGGQGSVWLADRPDGLVNRSVAIKLPIGLAFRPNLAERHAEPGSPTIGAFHSIAGHAFLNARRIAPAIEHLSAAAEIATRTLGPANVNTLGVRGSLALAKQRGRPAH